MDESTFGDPGLPSAKVENFVNDLILELLQVLTIYVRPAKSNDMNLEWPIAPDKFSITLPNCQSIVSKRMVPSSIEREMSGDLSYALAILYMRLSRYG